MVRMMSDVCQSKQTHEGDNVAGFDLLERVTKEDPRAIIKWVMIDAHHTAQIGYKEAQSHGLPTWHQTLTSSLLSYK